MSKTLYVFSARDPNEFLRLAEGDDAALQVVLPSADQTVSEVLKQQYEVVSFLPTDFEQFKVHLKVVDWKVNQLGYADSLVLRPEGYKPYNCSAEAVLSVIKQNRRYINTQMPVIVIGATSFVVPIAAMLATAGFYKIIISPVGKTGEPHEQIREKLRAFAFNLDIEVVAPVELTGIEVTASLLISDFIRTEAEDAYGLITYFNFLSPRSLLIDCRSQTEGSLTEEARKADISVIEQNDVLKAKHDHLIELIKNSPLV